MKVRWIGLCEGLLITALAFLLASIAWSVTAAFAGLPPLAVLTNTISGAFGSKFALEQTLRAATPLLLTGLCVAVPARAGLLVIGGEGAFVLGGLAAAVAAVNVPPAASLPAAMVAGMAVGGLWLGLSGWLRAARGVHEAVSGLLLTYVAIAIFNQLVEGPLRDPASLDKPATALIPVAAQVGSLGFTNLHWGLVAGICACLLAHVLVSHTPFGFSLRAVGGNARAALFAGMPIGRNIVCACLLGGALAGLGGAFEVVAVNHRASATLALGYGYIGILVAALSRGNMLAVIFAAVLVGALDVGAGTLQRRLDAPAASASMMHGLLFISLVTCAALQGRVVAWVRERKTDD